MSEPFLGEIRMFAGNFAPRGYALCDGQILSITQNEALFSLFGTIYGGDGRTTFGGLPELRGRVPVHMGTGPGLSPQTIGRKSGAETATLTAAHLPAHRHTMNASTSTASETRPADNVPAGNTAVDLYRAPGTASHSSSASATTSTGTGTPHPNVQPFLCIHYIVALVGTYPSRL